VALLVFHRGQDPGLTDKLIDRQRERRRARVARLELIDGACQIALEAGPVDLEVPEDPGEVGVGRCGELRQLALDFD
jgi:hypothetical protein